MTLRSVRLDKCVVTVSVLHDLLLHPLYLKTKESSVTALTLVFASLCTDTVCLCSA